MSRTRSGVIRITCTVITIYVSSLILVSVNKSLRDRSVTSFLQLLRKSILQMTDPVIEGPLGRPPFETPTIAKAVSNFVLAKFNSSPKVRSPDDARSDWMVLAMDNFLGFGGRYLKAAAHYAIRRAECRVRGGDTATFSENGATLRLRGRRNSKSRRRKSLTGVCAERRKKAEPVQLFRGMSRRRTRTAARQPLSLFDATTV